MNFFRRNLEIRANQDCAQWPKLSLLWPTMNGGKQQQARSVGSHFLFAYFNGSQFIANKFVAKSLEQGRGVANSARVANFYLAK